MEPTGPAIVAAIAIYVVDATALAPTAAAVIATAAAAARAVVAVAADVVIVTVASIATATLHHDTSYTLTPFFHIDVALRSAPSVASCQLPQWPSRSHWPPRHRPVHEFSAK